MLFFVVISQIFFMTTSVNGKLIVQDISSQLFADTTVDSISFKSMYKNGRLIEVNFIVSINTALSNGSAIFGGLPKPLSSGGERFNCVASNSGIHTPIEFYYSNGYLAAFYPQTGITGNGSVITGHFTYISE